MNFTKGLSIALVLGLVACGSPTEVSNGSETPPTENSSETTSSTEAIPVGTAVDVRNDRSITVNSSEEVQSISSEFATTVEPKGGKLVVVYLTMANTGQESGNMMWTQFQLVDSQDRKYEEIQDFEETVTVHSWLESKELENPTNQLFPGGTAETAKVFRVAPDAEGLQLVVNEKALAIQ